MIAIRFRRVRDSGVVVRRFGHAECRAQTIERDVELPVIDVRSRDSANDRRRRGALVRAQQVQRRLVPTTGNLALTRPIGSLRLFDERRDRGRQDVGVERRLHLPVCSEGSALRGTIFLASVGREMPSSRAAAA